MVRISFTYIFVIYKQLFLLQQFFILFTDKFIDELLPSDLLTNLNGTLNSNPALVILGPDNKSKATFINDLLSCNALPLANEGNWRMVKFQYNKTPSINLSLGLKPDFIDDVKVQIDFNTQINFCSNYFVWKKNIKIINIIFDFRIISVPGLTSQLTLLKRLENMKNWIG